MTFPFLPCRWQHYKANLTNHGWLRLPHIQPKSAAAKLIKGSINNLSKVLSLSHLQVSPDMVGHFWTFDPPVMCNVSYPIYNTFTRTHANNYLLLQCRLVSVYVCVPACMCVRYCRWRKENNLNCMKMQIDICIQPLPSKDAQKKRT